MIKQRDEQAEHTHNTKEIHRQRHSSLLIDIDKQVNACEGYEEEEEDNEKP